MGSFVRTNRHPDETRWIEGWEFRLVSGREEGRDEDGRVWAVEVMAQDRSVQTVIRSADGRADLEGLKCLHLAATSITIQSLFARADELEGVANSNTSTASMERRSGNGKRPVC